MRARCLLNDERTGVEAFQNIEILIYLSAAFASQTPSHPSPSTHTIDDRPRAHLHSPKTFLPFQVPAPRSPHSTPTRRSSTYPKLVTQTSAERGCTLILVQPYDPRSSLTPQIFRKFHGRPKHPAIGPPPQRSCLTRQPLLRLCIACPPTRGRAFPREQFSGTPLPIFSRRYPYTQPPN